MLDYDLIISDVDGVVFREGEPIWENIQSIRQMISRGKKVIFVTNNSGFSRVLLSRQLNYVGLDVSSNDIITSALSAAIYMKRKTDIKSVYVIGEEGLVEEMKNFSFQLFSSTDVEVKNPDSVILGLDRLSNYDKISAGMRCIYNGSKFIATNMDRLWPSKDGLKLGAGALAAAIVYALRREPDFVAGKPNKWIIEVAMELASIKDLSKVLVIGDQLETDIKMGNDIGADTILVLTGISTERDVEKSDVKPTRVVKNLSSIL
ncbi:HAD-IIA family hydrolase [Candidatus Acidianus copahuensis]|uniref:HAD family hydrolase n=1 Tax=Candidatus Acidianus copahuensis TaxID=1160895 RepID=A0A031LUK6_9CREN|nr:HAD-IIA family hydrolase [Candidatus Acidianus copahuensis]EZQ11144.1 HAD family hydrolase [Candidatus Acidianus copahuensis]NON63655.1 HAD-IIA family hydrolase [Acidianus sp. RZ1]